MSVKPILFSGPMVRALIDGRKSQTRRVVKPQPKLTPHHEPVRVERRGERGWIWMVHTDRPDYQFATGDWRAPYAPGDLLYVREAWGVGTRPDPIQGWRDGIEYRADEIGLPDGESLPLYSDCVPDDVDLSEYACRWRPSIHMPRWASRLTLRVTDVRVQRVQAISEDDALAEGLFRWEYTDVDGDPRVDPLAHAYTDVGFHWKQTDTPFDGFGRARDAFENLWDSLNAPRGFGWDANPWVCAVTFEVIKANVDELANTRERATAEE